MIEHPQVQANDLIRTLEHPVAGTYRQPRPPPRFESTPADVRTHAPALGEHTREVLAALGLPAAEVDRLYREGIVR